MAKSPTVRFIGEARIGDISAESFVTDLEEADIAKEAIITATEWDDFDDDGNILISSATLWYASQRLQRNHRK